MRRLKVEESECERTIGVFVSKVIDTLRVRDEKVSIQFKNDWFLRLVLVCLLQDLAECQLYCCEGWPDARDDRTAKEPNGKISLKNQKKAGQPDSWNTIKRIVKEFMYFDFF